MNARQNIIILITALLTCVGKQIPKAFSATISFQIFFVKANTGTRGFGRCIIVSWVDMSGYKLLDIYLRDINEVL